MGYSMPMRSAIFLLTAVLFLSRAEAGAGEQRRIELVDGSILSGEVLSYADGVYTLHTDALGTVTVEDSRVRTIGSCADPAPASSSPDAQVRSLQERMESDPGIMGIIDSLKDDPAFRQILDDPALLKAVESGDLASLMASPKFLQLLQNSKVQEIQEKLGE